MSATSCTDPRAGQLLHAYELRALDDAALERFEEHLIGCTHCFEEVRGFAAQAAMLREDPQLRATVLEAATQADLAPPPSARRDPRWGWLWPPGPWSLRRLAPLGGVLLVAAFAAGRWLASPPPGAASGVRPLQAITLAPGRAAEEPRLKRVGAGPGAVRFVFEGARADRPCAVALLAEDATVVWSDPAFRSFDLHQSGWLLLPLERMSPGVYRLVIRDPQLSPELATREYRFRIVP